MEKHPYFNALQRPRPIEVAGTTESFSYDQEQNRFTCSWNEDEHIQQPSTFFLPGVNNADALDIKLTPDVKGLEVKFTDLTSGTILSIESAKKNLNRELVIKF